MTEFSHGAEVISLFDDPSKSSIDKYRMVSNRTTIKPDLETELKWFEDNSVNVTAIHYMCDVCGQDHLPQEDIISVICNDCGGCYDYCKNHYLIDKYPLCTSNNPNTPGPNENFKIFKRRVICTICDEDNSSLEDIITMVCSKCHKSYDYCYIHGSIAHCPHCS